MNKYLFKFMLLLTALFASQQVSAVTVYYHNTNNWNTPTAYMWNSGGNNVWPGAQMSNLGGGWFAVNAGNYQNIIFSNSGSDQTADQTIPTDGKNAYDNGNWTKLVWYLRHPWGGGDNWEWRQLTDNGDGTYSTEDYYGGVGCNWYFEEVEDAYASNWVGSPTLVGNPKSGDKCIFTLNPIAGTITISKIYTPVNSVKVYGGLWSDHGWDTSGRDMNDDDNDGVFTYSFTYDSNKSFNKYFYVTVNGTHIADNAGQNSVKQLNTPYAYKNASGIWEYNISDITLENGTTYTLKIDTNNKTLQIDGTTVYKWIDKVYILGVNNDWTNGTEVGSYHGIYTYQYTAQATDAKKHWAYRVIYNDGSTKYFTPNAKDVAIALDATQNYTVKDARGDDSWYCEAITAGCSYNIVLNTNDGTVKIIRTGGFAEGDIPVYPEGVNSEAELFAYDFSAQPVYYLLGKVLNNNRVSPEWQMTKGADGKYHLNGFAMRSTICRDYNGGDANFDGKVKVRQYTAVNTHTDLDEKSFTEGLPSNPLSEGRLFNATFDPETGKLTLAEDLSANHKMPFVSLVGYMMQQDKVYTTPRGVEGTPAGVNTTKGWQEAWLQYDATGKLLKDRRGNVMYSTMWPPKNPIYFTANVNGERQYSSDQMTFKPVKGNDGVYVAKTGAEWEAELKNGENAEAYLGLDLDDSKTYYRYVVEDIWYVGATKIWTGWGGQTTLYNKVQSAQWWNHTNWGYGSKRDNDTDGEPINAETTYGVNSDDGKNGNFIFSDPTFFKTIEFFYENDDAKHNSKIYTTLAYGSASIAAKSNKESDDTYKKGSYQPTVNVPEGVTVTGYTIYRYDAATNQLAPIGNDGGLVAQGTNDPNATTFEFDTEGLAEGRYYYVLTVNFSNDRTATVRSNPFIIHFPGQYTLEVKGYQLVKLNEPFTQGGVAYDYVTYISEKDANMYFVNLSEDGNVTGYASVQGENRAGMQNKFAQNAGIKWTDKVFVYGQVPSEFKKDADKANATVSTDDIKGYSLTAGAQTSSVAAFGANHNLATIDNQYNFATKTYKAVMNYLEKDIEGESKTAKATLGKESYTTMVMPNVTADASAVTVTKTENTEVLNIIDGDNTKQKASDYYTVNVALSFNDPNVIAQNAPRYEVVVSKDGEQTVKVYKAQNEGTRTVNINGVNPLDFENATVSVSAKYFDGVSYNLPATIGEGAVLEAGDAKFQKFAWPLINSVDVVRSNVLKEGSTTEHKPVVFITEMSTTFDGGDKIGNTTLDKNCVFNVDFTIDDQDAPAYSEFLDYGDINFVGELEIVDKHHVWSKFIQFDNTSGKTEDDDVLPFKAAVTPVYVAKVTNTQTTENLEEATVVTAAPAEAAYVALRGNESEYVLNQIPTGINDITTNDAPKARKVIENGQVYIICGERKFNVMGAEIK
ncbi:MAG: starch-binding protein [Bacteroidales bacterium]|nr:starch-binding protein [Bacteroidales bacterium]